MLIEERAKVLMTEMFSIDKLITYSEHDEYEEHVNLKVEIDESLEMIHEMVTTVIKNLEGLVLGAKHHMTELSESWLDIVLWFNQGKKELSREEVLQTIIEIENMRLENLIIEQLVGNAELQIMSIAVYDREGIAAGKYGEEIPLTCKEPKNLLESGFQNEIAVGFAVINGVEKCREELCSDAKRDAMDKLTAKINELGISECSKYVTIAEPKECFYGPFWSDEAIKHIAEVEQEFLVQEDMAAHSLPTPPPRAKETQ